MTHRADPLAGAEQSAHTWLDHIATSIGTEDRQYAYRVLRSWLRLIRDRMTVESAAHFGAQLPELLRGVYYEGWVPRLTPMRYDAPGFTIAFADQTGVPYDDVPGLVGAITTALRDLCSPGQVEHVLEVLPTGLRDELDASGAAGRRRSDLLVLQERLEALDGQVSVLTEAMGVLVHGLEQTPTDVPIAGRSAEAAQEAHRLLMASPPAQA